MKKVIFTWGIATAVLFGFASPILKENTTEQSDSKGSRAVVTDDEIIWNGSTYQVREWIGQTGDAVTETQYGDTNYWVGQDMYEQQYLISYEHARYLGLDVNLHDFENQNDNLGSFKVSYPGYNSSRGSGAAYIYNESNSTVYVSGAAYTYAGSLDGYFTGGDELTLTPIEGDNGYELVNDSVFKRSTANDTYYYFNRTLYSLNDYNEAGANIGDLFGTTHQTSAGDMVVQLNNGGYAISTSNKILKVESSSDSLYESTGLTTYITTDDTEVQWTLLSDAMTFDEVNDDTRIAILRDGEEFKGTEWYAEFGNGTITNKVWNLETSDGVITAANINGEYFELVEYNFDPIRNVLTFTNANNEKFVYLVDSGMLLTEGSAEYKVLSSGDIVINIEGENFVFINGKLYHVIADLTGSELSPNIKGSYYYQMETIVGEGGTPEQKQLLTNFNSFESINESSEMAELGYVHYLNDDQGEIWEFNNSEREISFLNLNSEFSMITNSIEVGHNTTLFTTADGNTYILNLDTVYNVNNIEYQYKEISKGDFIIELYGNYFFKANNAIYQLITEPVKNIEADIDGTYFFEGKQLTRDEDGSLNPEPKTIVTDFATFEEANETSRIATFSEEDTMDLSNGNMGYLLRTSGIDIKVIRNDGIYLEVEMLFEPNIQGIEETVTVVKFVNDDYELMIIIDNNGSMELQEMPEYEKPEVSTPEDEPSEIELTDVIESVGEDVVEEVIEEELGIDQVPTSVSIDGHEVETEVVVKNTKMEHVEYVTATGTSIEITVVHYEDPLTHQSYYQDISRSGLWDSALNATSVAEAIAAWMIIILIFFLGILALVLIASAVTWFGSSVKRRHY